MMMMLWIVALSLFGLEIGIWPLLIIYSICALVGLVGFIAILFLGDVFDVGDVDIDADIGDIDLDTGGPSPFSLPIIMFYILSFGCIGIILLAIGLEPIWTPFISLPVAIIPAVVAYFAIWFMFTKVQSTTVEHINKFKGARGKVSINIRPPNEGQVILPSKTRGFIPVGAVADEFIARGDEVKVVDTYGSTVKVEKLSGPSKKKDRGEGKKKASSTKKSSTKSSGKKKKS
jgi:membrane protein implicated in regulation of membrane protease activity